MNDTSGFGAMLRDVESSLIDASNHINDGRREEGHPKYEPQLVTIEVHIDTALQLVQALLRAGEEQESS